MAAEDTSKVCEAHPMIGGDGPNSYAKNSTFQQGVLDVAKELIRKAIAEKLDIDISSSSTSFKIADLGCSVGPNTFFAVENIVEAVELKYQGQGMNSQIPEFQVFFNDHTSNDFNILFKSLPQNRRYYAAGVPGSFYGRLFPNASIHIAHSSYGIHFLSRVPKAVMDRNSPAWNKGHIWYSNSTDEVVRAYKAQYAEDMECFLHARAQETVHGGLMLLTFPGSPAGFPHSRSVVGLELLGSCLMDLVRKGVVSEEKVDSFNMPVYSMSPQELEVAVKRNG
ncbi:putative loganate O-methyltransferase [Rosa chinensis]|uniref:Putative loganate O-methyltransferase n=1 Tax=Rosa chinensis TaxID=74649 RepID=A0A2P6P1T6_ROSCH|nr:loganic acid O-methyltransferase [Rosa chinensis]PRQ15890.1 putative loganate O-methyltransferase [Rosa chinensis]